MPGSMNGAKSLSSGNSECDLNQSLASQSLLSSLASRLRVAIV